MKIKTKGWWRLKQWGAAHWSVLQRTLLSSSYDNLNSSSPSFDYRQASFTSGSISVWFVRICCLTVLVQYQVDCFFAALASPHNHFRLIDSHLLSLQTQMSVLTTAVRTRDNSLSVQLIWTCFELLCHFIIWTHNCDHHTASTTEATISDSCSQEWWPFAPLQ